MQPLESERQEMYVHTQCEQRHWHEVVNLGRNDPFASGSAFWTFHISQLVENYNKTLLLRLK